MSAPAEERRCEVCLDRVDEDGNTLGGCPLMSPPGECEECGSCLCDGSC